MTAPDSFLIGLLDLRTHASWRYSLRMRGRLAIRLAIIGLSLSALCPSTTKAQSTKKSDDCLPDPSWGSTSVTIKILKESYTKIRVEEVSFEGAYDLPEQSQAEITDRIKENGPYGDPEFASYLEEIVKEAFQDLGYYYAKVSAQSRVLSRDPLEEKVSITFFVAQGLQYRLGGVQFVHGLVFPPSELREQIPLQDGDVFDLAKLRVGIEALTKLHGSQGYINLTANPDLEVDIAHQTISVRLELEEDRQFRVGKVEVFGLDPQISLDDLRIVYKPGDVFNFNLLNDFYQENQDVLPPGLSPADNTYVKQDPRNNTVAIVFDVRDCHSPTQ
jgi:outer membrane protein insertion porin family